MYQQQPFGNFYNRAINTVPNQNMVNTNFDSFNSNSFKQATMNIHTMDEHQIAMLVKNNIDEIVDTSNYLVFDTAMVKNIILRFSNKENEGKTRIRIVNSAEEFATHKFKDDVVNQKIFTMVAGKCFKTNGWKGN